MTFFLCLAFFLSGLAAVLFESLWFYQAGLGLGNSIWASSLVLSSFMGGLAVGNGVVARVGDWVRRPILAYAGLEVAIAVTASGLVLLMPLLPGALAPLFRPLLQLPWLLNPLRLLISFSLPLLPAPAAPALSGPRRADAARPRYRLHRTRGRRLAQGHRHHGSSSGSVPRGRGRRGHRADHRAGDRP